MPPKRSNPTAIALSSATYQLLGVLGPGLAGSIAAFVGIRQVFFLDGITFLIAAILVVTLPGQLMVAQQPQEVRTVRRTLQDIRLGTTCLLNDPVIRYALAMMASHLPSSVFLGSSLIGAVIWVIVNLVFHPGQQSDRKRGLWHDHNHTHGQHHQHHHSRHLAMTVIHSHLHFHTVAQLEPC